MRGCGNDNTDEHDVPNDNWIGNFKRHNAYKAGGIGIYQNIIDTMNIVISNIQAITNNVQKFFIKGSSIGIFVLQSL